MDLVRSILQPVTHNLPQPIRSAGLSLLGPACYKKIILDIDPTPSPCLSLFISKSVGLGIIAASSVVKIPQLLKLVSSQSSAGVSFLSYLLETTSYTISLIYNARNGFPFSTYGETALILVQNIIISVLVLKYDGRGAGAAIFIAGLASAVWALQDEKVVDMRLLSYLQAGAGLLGVASKAPQIWTIYRQGGTGQLSAFAIFNYLAGSLSRIFTTLQEVDDNLILYNFVAGFLLNAVLAAQMVYYWNGSGSGSTMKGKGKQAVGKGKQAKGRIGMEREEMEMEMEEKEEKGSSTGTVAGGKAKGPTTRRRG